MSVKAPHTPAFFTDIQIITYSSQAVVLNEWMQRTPHHLVNLLPSAVQHPVRLPFPPSLSWFALGVANLIAVDRSLPLLSRIHVGEESWFGRLAERGVEGGNVLSAKYLVDFWVIFYFFGLLCSWMVKWRFGRWPNNVGCVSHDWTGWPCCIVGTTDLVQCINLLFWGWSFFCVWTWILTFPLIPLKNLSVFWDFHLSVWK